jgi:hypothetical protein
MALLPIRNMGQKTVLWSLGRRCEIHPVLSIRQFWHCSYAIKGGSILRVCKWASKFQMSQGCLRDTYD